MRILLPSDGGVRLQAEIRCAASEDLHPVVLGLRVEHLPTWERDNPGLHTLLLEDLRSSDGNLDLGPCRNDVEVLLAVRDVVQDVAALGASLDGRVHEVGQILTGEGDNGGRVLGVHGDQVGCADLVTVCGTPEVEIGDGAEMGGDFYGLMGGTVLSKPDGVVSGDPDHLMLRESAQADGTGSVGDEVLG